MINKELCHKVCELVKETAQFIRTEAAHFTSSDVEVKSFNQLVSYVDKTAEERLVAGLEKLLPGSGFITEEDTVDSVDRKYIWVIDPLNGTTNFIHGVPVYSISIGLLRDMKTVMGVVYEINQDELFYAWEGSAAFLNGKEIRVSENNVLSKSLLATGFPYYDFNTMQHYLNALHELLQKTHGMRRMGSAAVDLAYTACGRFDGFFEYGLKPWDVAGGTFIVQQAGGKVSDFSGNNDFLFSDELIASSNGIYQELLEIIQAAFKSNN